MAVLDLDPHRSHALPNSLALVTERVAAGKVRPSTVWSMLFLRPGLAVGMQLIFTIGFALSGSADPWREAADWWLVSLAAGELLNFWLLGRLARGEGLRLRDLYNLGGRATMGGDLKWILLVILVAGPIAYLPNVLLGSWLWGDATTGAELSFRAIPLAAAWATLFVFPVIHALTELPTYFGYVMPRLQALRGSRWTGLAAAAVVLSLQHAFLPLLFDWRFLVWRSFMFIGFAFLMGWVIDRRPTVLPYAVGAHALLDATLPIFVLLASM